MQTEKRTISPRLFYISVSLFSSAIFVTLGICLLSFVEFLNQALIIILGWVFLTKSLVVGFVVTSTAKRGSKETNIIFIGMYHGRITSALAGAMIGLAIANWVGAIIGFVVFYFIGRWAGPKVSIFLANQIEQFFQVQEFPKVQTAPASSKKGYFYVTLYLLVPVLFVFIASLFKYFQILPDTISKYFPQARIVVYALTIFAIVYPWLVKKRIIENTKNIEDLVIILQALGFIFSSVPTVLGFFLFMLGASIIEHFTFAGVAIISSLVWYIYVIRKEYGLPTVSS